MSAIEITHAKKNYGDTQALKGVDLIVNRGEFFGLLGPNGAGKTTLISCIVGLGKLDQGSISVMGHDVVKESLKSKSVIGFAPQEMNLDRFFSIERILCYQAGFFGIPKSKRLEIAHKLLDQFDLTEKKDMPYYRLSGGMQKRLLVAKAMVNDPQVLILDEPTAGVDVKQRHDLWKYLRHLNENGTTIILTTHYIDEAEALCERIGIIDLGEIKEIDQTQNLIQKYCQKKIIYHLSKPIDISKFSNIDLKVELDGNRLIVSGKDRAIEMIEQTLSLIKSDDTCRVIDMQVQSGSLEEVFLKVAGKKWSES